MKCRDLEELLSAYADGELPRAQREFVEEHLADCSQCQATLADYMKVRQQLTSLRVVPTMPDIKGSTMSKIKDMHNRSVRRWMRPALAAISVVIVLIVLLVLQPWGSLPGGIMAKACATTEGLLSYRTSSSLVSTHNGETTIWDSEGEYAAPDRYRGKFTLGNSTFEVITIGDKNYAWRADNTTDNAWSAGIYGWPLSKEDTLSLLDLLTKIENLPDERIAGVDCFHLRGEFDEEIVKSMDEQAAAIEVVVEVWIGKDDYLIRQVTHNVQIFASDGGVGTFSYLEVYYDFNEPIEIEPPLDVDGKLLPGWQLIESSAQSPQG
jgi:hypothetical protein